MLWLLILCFLPLNFLFDFYLIISQYWFQKDLLGYLPLHTSPFIFYLICLLTNLMKSSFHCRPSVVEHLCNPSTQRLRQEDHVFDTSLGYIMRSSLTNNKSSNYYTLGCFTYLLVSFHQLLFLYDVSCFKTYLLSWFHIFLLPLLWSSAWGKGTLWTNFHGASKSFWNQKWDKNRKES
jgi:hypothetical protein